MNTKDSSSTAPHQSNNLLVVGLTGGIGSGKTTVSDLFRSLGVTIIDTDIIARELVDNNSSVLKEIADIFGNKVLTPDGTLDRKKLAQKVFSQPHEKQKLESILHPRIRSEVNNRIQSLKTGNTAAEYVIVVVPLLFETDFTDLVDRILVVIADEKTRTERVRNRDNRNLDEIRSIIKSQVNDEIRLRQADDIIQNNSNFKDLKTKVRKFHDKYTALSGKFQEKS
jgi:dephospho-CoA kinase